MITTVTQGTSGGWDTLAGVSGIPVSVPDITCKEKSLQGFNHLMPELNPSAQCCLTRFFTGDFAS
jgi:hypothetical protein